MYQFNNQICELITIIEDNHNHDENDMFPTECIYFKDSRAHEIGKNLYKLGGIDALFYVLNVLQIELFPKYRGSLRELEFRFSGIDPRFQA